MSEANVISKLLCARLMLAELLPQRIHYIASNCSWSIQIRYLHFLASLLESEALFITGKCHSSLACKRHSICRYSEDLSLKISYRIDRGGLVPVAYLQSVKVLRLVYLQFKHGESDSWVAHCPQASNHWISTGKQFWLWSTSQTHAALVTSPSKDSLGR